MKKFVSAVGVFVASIFMLGATTQHANAASLKDGIYKNSQSVYYVLSGKKLAIPKAKAYNVIFSATRAGKMGIPISNNNFLLLRKPCGNVSPYENETCAKKWKDEVNPFAESLMGKFVIEVEHLGEMHYIYPTDGTDTSWGMTEIEPLTRPHGEDPLLRDQMHLYKWFKRVASTASKPDLSALTNL